MLSKNYGVRTKRYKASVIVALNLAPPVYELNNTLNGEDKFIGACTKLITELRVGKGLSPTLVGLINRFTDYLSDEAVFVCLKTRFFVRRVKSAM